MRKPIGTILVFHDSIEVTRLDTNGSTDTRYPEPTAEKLNDAARVLGCWLGLAGPPLPPVFKDAPMHGYEYENARRDDDPNDDLPPQSTIDTSPHFDIDDLIMSTASYYLGRRTVSVDDFCTRLVLAWLILAAHVKDYIRRMVEAEFIKEEIFIKDGHPGLVENLFGDACDRESWMKVRECWKSNPQSSP